MRYFVFLGLSCLIPLSLHAEFNPVERVSVDNNGQNGDGESSVPGISSSDDGRYVAFQSAATNLVSGDENMVRDIFVYDRTNDTIERVSVDDDGSEANGESRNPSISEDGRYVVFESDADNLVNGDTNGVTDVFLYDRTDDTIERISVDSNEMEADDRSSNPFISPNGMYVVFQSAATDLTASDSNGRSDIFLRDIAGGTTVIISISSDDEEANGDSRFPTIDNSGDLVVFDSTASNLVDGDDNGASDVFLRTISAGTTEILSTDDNGEEGDDGSFRPVISADGEYVAFFSDAENFLNEDDNGLRDVFLVELDSGDISLVSVPAFGNDANGISQTPKISEDGMFVVFESLATNLVVGDDNALLDVFAYDRSDQTVVRLSVDDDGDELEALSRSGAINGNGQFVAYVSEDSEIVSGDENMLPDVFVVDTQCLLEPAGVVPGDQDSDGTNDCDDACPEDAAKIALGDCGCGVADTDSDADGTADCNDECDADANKTLEGECGCGVSDDDINGNGVADCLDPTRNTRPRRPIARYRPRRDVIRVILPGDFQGFRYVIQVRQNREVVRKRRTRRYRNRISARGLSGRVFVRYRVLLDPGRTKLSKRRRVIIR